MKGKHDLFNSAFSYVILSSNTLWLPWHPILGLFIVLNKPMLHKKSLPGKLSWQHMSVREVHKLQHIKTAQAMWQFGCSVSVQWFCLPSFQHTAEDTQLCGMCLVRSSKRRARWTLVFMRMLLPSVYDCQGWWHGVNASLDTRIRQCCQNISLPFKHTTASGSWRQM